jgi:hypothetical protein
MQDQHGDLFPAFSECLTLEEFTAAGVKYPAAMDYDDAVAYATNVCASYPELASSNLRVDREVRR